MSTWQQLSTNDRVAILQQIQDKEHIHALAVEKDWWVTIILNALFHTSCAHALSFKGGTSLSKAWGLIDRFSEDVDLAISHHYFGIEKTNKNQRDKLRKQSRKFIIEQLANELEHALLKMGVRNFHLEPVTTIQTAEGLRPIDSDKDPTVINVKYRSVLNSSLPYILPQVKIEISCLSMEEPVDEKEISSIISRHFPSQDSDNQVRIPTVVPTRTFLEKVFLLHEEYQRQHPRSHRMSRHLYDIERLMDSPYGQAALDDMALYDAIVHHRSVYNAIKGVDYATHHPSTINFIPTNEIIADWEKDYETMKHSFIYGNSPSFSQLIERMKELTLRFRNVGSELSRKAIIDK